MSEKKKEFDIFIAENIKIICRIYTKKNDVVSFIIQLTFYEDNIWYNVVRYDSYHQVPHRDILDIDNNIIDKHFFINNTNKEILEFGLKDLRSNYEEYIKTFKKTKK